MRLANLIHSIFGERSVWKTINVLEIASGRTGKTVAFTYILEDQFGNVKSVKVDANG